MKTVFLLVLCLVSLSPLSGQSFSISVSPATQSVIAGDVAAFNIHISPSGGFSATVTLTASSTLQCSLPSQFINSPYPDQTLSVKTFAGDSGTKKVYIVARNMGVADTVECVLHISKNVFWQKMKGPTGLMFGTSTTIDNDGNFCILDAGHLYPALYRYRSQKWETTSFTEVNSNMESMQGMYNVDGSFWFCTVSGLCKYDGTFMTIYPLGTSGLPSGTLDLCDHDRNGEVYVRSANKIYRFNSSQQYDVTAGLPTDSTLSHSRTSQFCFDSTSSLIVSTGHEAQPLRRLPVDDAALVNTHCSRYISCIRSAPDGSTWMLESSNSSKSSIMHYANGTVTSDSLPTPNNTFLHRLSFDHRGYVWVASSAGLWMYNGKAWTSYTTFNSAIPFNEIEGLECDGRGNVWLMHGASIAVFNPDGLQGIPIISTDIASSDDQSFFVSPNPAQSFIRTSEQGIQTIEISSINGQSLSCFQQDLSSNPIIDLSALASSSYVIRIGAKAQIVHLRH